MGGGGCHQERQWEGAAKRKMAHFGKGIKRVESGEVATKGFKSPVATQRSSLMVFRTKPRVINMA